MRPALLLAVTALAAACSGPPGPQATPTQITQLQRQVVIVQGQPLSMLVAGDPKGRKVIFLHGTPGDATGWADYLTSVPSGFRYIAPDRPGFGESGPDGALPSLADQASAIAALLDEADTGRAILVGHSLGAPIAAQLAVDHPGRIAALVLVAGALDPAQEKIHWAQPIGAWGPVERLLPRAIRNANHELMALKPQLQALEPRLASLRCPVFILHGTKDDLVPYANTGFMKAAMPAAPISLSTLEGRNHFLPWTSRPELEAMIAQAAAAQGPPC
jgi:pimeloyl-ACP methyl ester carboxylesterase